MDTKKVVLACIKGDAKSHEHLYEHFAPYIFTTCNRYGIKESQEKDIIQEIFIAIFSSLPSYDSSKASLKTWITSIAIHKILNLKKKRKLILDDITDHQSEIVTAPSAIYKLYVEDIWKAIDKMPDGFRVVFNMIEIDGYNHEEVAKTLNIKATTSRSQLHRAKLWLQRALITNDSVVVNNNIDK